MKKNKIFMNKDVFKDNLLKSIYEIACYKNLTLHDYLFKINPIIENDKTIETNDTIMRFYIIHERKISYHLFNIDEVVNSLAYFDNLVPVWIDIRYIQTVDKIDYFMLDSSIRVRKSTQIKNIENGHPPFRCIL